MTIPIIIKDLTYIMKIITKFPLIFGEENKGWHFYTRTVQLKFLKDSIKYHKHFQESIDINDIKQCFTQLSSDIQDHICENYIISSFDANGTITKYHD